MTLADEDTNSIPTDNANRAIQGNVAMSQNLKNNMITCKTNGANSQGPGEIRYKGKVCSSLMTNLDFCI